MKILPDVHHIDWLHDLAAAVAIVALPAVILFTMSADAIVFAILLMVAMSFLAGYLFVPRDLWLTFVIAFLLTWVSFGFADRIGAMGDGGSYDIPPWFVVVMILVPMIVVAFVPLWTGRLLKRDNMRIATRRRAATESH